MFQIESANLRAENIDLKKKLQNEKEDYNKDFKACVKMYEKVQKAVEYLQTIKIKKSEALRKVG